MALSYVAPKSLKVSMSWVHILFSHPPFKYKSNILNRPPTLVGSGRVHPKIRGSGWVGSVGYWVGSRNLDQCDDLYTVQLYIVFTGEYMRGDLHDVSDVVSWSLSREISTKLIAPVSRHIHTSRLQATWRRAGTVGRYYLATGRLRQQPGNICRSYHLRRHGGLRHWLWDVKYTLFRLNPDDKYSILEAERVCRGDAWNAADWLSR